MKVVLEKGQRLFFTSDTHYGHSNICSATTKWADSDSATRDFKSLEHMNDTLVNRINETVGENDILIHLGDFSFGGFENIQEFRSRIVCKNLHLIHGNHDHHIRRNKGDIQDIFTTCSDYIHLDLRIPNGSGTRKYTFVCMHYPICSWDGMNADVMHLHGHVHLPPHLRIAEGRAMDVGCDGNNLYPMNVEEVISLLRNRPIAKLTLPKDHHEKRLI